MERSEDTRARTWLLIALLAISVGAFGLTRVLRSSDDIVNTVVLTPTIAAGETAEVSFATTIDERRADVLIVDTDEQSVRALQLGERLPAGEHSFEWDGSADDGSAVVPGQYGLRVILGEEGRDIVPPGSIIVTEPEPASSLDAVPGAAG